MRSSPRQRQKLMLQPKPHAFKASFDDQFVAKIRLQLIGIF